MASRRQPERRERKFANDSQPLERATWPTDSDLLSAGILDGALKARDLAPRFTLRDSSGNLIKLSDLIDTGPVVVRFYPGEWCKHCGADLSALAGIHSQIKRTGARLVAISPKVPAREVVVSAKPKRSIPLLIDVGSSVAKAFGVAYALTNRICIEHMTLRTAFRASEGERGLLSFPGTFLIDGERRIVCSYVALDHASRVEPADLLAVLQSLRDGRPSDPP